MSTLTLGQARQHIETDLNDDALQLLIDAAEDYIVEKAGELATQIDEYRGEILATILLLTRKATEITTVIEEIKSGDSYESTTLETDDYQLRHDGRMIERLRDGSNPRGTWGDVVTITYEPVDDTNKRKVATINLVKLDIEYNALKSERVGDYSSQSQDYETERARIVNGLKPWRI